MYPHPIAIPLLGVSVSAHDVMVGMSVVVSLVLISISARVLEGLSPWRVLGAVLVMALFAFACGRAHFVALRWGFDATRLMRLDQNIHAGGAIVGAVVGAWAGARWLALPFGRLGDACMPAAGVGVVLARLGCFAHGCCYGTICTLPWCFTWPAGTMVHAWHQRVGNIAADATASPPLHPLQLYFALLGLLMSVVALVLYRRKQFHGQVALGCLTLFAAGSTVLEFWRVDYPERPYWGPLPQLTWTALALTLALGVALAWATYTHRRASAPGHATVASPVA